uniref:Disease resistance N-terminal domain-containing protein n=1 Tax=Nelumbo nucifera TaxID=4432 RepID=A0A822YKU3_NELNU|nr:TPA_asm: hypothetical protein HUJ06_011042 [Nelumbo nucifera]
MATTEDVVVSPLLQALLNKLNSSWMIKFGSDWGVDQERDNLCITLQGAYAMASSTEDMQISDPRLKFLLKHMREVVHKATCILDEFIYEAVQRKILEEEEDDDESKQICTSRAAIKKSCKDDELPIGREPEPEAGRIGPNFSCIEFAGC